MNRKWMQLTVVTMITVVVMGLVYAGASRMRQVLGKEKMESGTTETGLHAEFMLWELTGNTILNAKMAD